MLRFTLSISCLTTSSLPWFMDLTFQVLRQYCSLQHRTFTSSPITSTTGHCFCFGSISSFFLELFFLYSPVAYWAPTDLGVHLSVSYLFAFSCCSWGSPGKISKWFTIRFSSGAHFVRTLHHDLSILGTIKDRNGLNLTEADVKKRWQEYTEELYKKDLYDSDNHDAVWAIS